MAQPNGLNPSFGGTVSAGADFATSAGGVTAPVLRFSTNEALGLYFGSGAPTIVGAKGSIYVNITGSSTSTRLYVNTGGSTVWTSVTTAA